MDRVQTVLLDPDQLSREGLRRLLEGTDFDISGDVSTFSQASNALRDEGAELLLFDLCTHSEEAFEFLRQIRAKHVGLKTVVLASRISGALLAKALDAGADGYLLKDDLSSETLLQFLRLVMLGEKVLPSRLAGMIGDISTTDNGGPAAANVSNLSQRETEVLRCLVQGHSNRTIARELGISESTVKAHIKALFRKIKVSNRTQAAIWALKHGLGSVNGDVASSLSAA